MFIWIFPVKCTSSRIGQELETLSLFYKLATLGAFSAMLLLMPQSNKMQVLFMVTSNVVEVFWWNWVKHDTDNAFNVQTPWDITCLLSVLWDVVLVLWICCAELEQSLIYVPACFPQLLCGKRGEALLGTSSVIFFFFCDRVVSPAWACVSCIKQKMHGFVPLFLAELWEFGRRVGGKRTVAWRLWSLKPLK